MSDLPDRFDPLHAVTRPAPSERRLAALCLAGLVLSAPLLSLILFAFFTFTGWGEAMRLPYQIDALEPRLTQYAAAVRAGTIPPRGCGYELPDLPWYAPRVDAVTMDANGNVYFVTCVFITFDSGFVLRNGDAEFLGDQMERRLYTEHLSGPWWGFSAD